MFYLQLMKQLFLGYARAVPERSGFFLESIPVLSKENTIGDHIGIAGSTQRSVLPGTI
jgi:hypothetical protein